MLFTFLYSILTFLESCNKCFIEIETWNEGTRKFVMREQGKNEFQMTEVQAITTGNPFGYIKK